MLASVGLHLGLLCPAAWQQNKPEPQPVINAKLLEPNAKQPELQPLTANSATLSPSSPPLKPQKTKPMRKKPPHPIVQTPAPNTTTTSSVQKSVTLPASNTESTVGLHMSQDELAIDPLERSFQQQILAHMRNKIRAPSNLNGSVRLEIQYSYRQLITQVRVIRSSNDDEFDDWAIKAILGANPYPTVPKDLPENYLFRPTLQVAP